MGNIVKIVLVTIVSMQLSAVYSFAENKAVKEAKPITGEVAKQEPKTIFSFKKELGLTDKQVEEMKALVSTLQTTMSEKGKTASDLRNELGKMIKEKANLASIKTQLKKIADLQVEVAYLDIETARKIDGILTEKQHKKWQEIQNSSLDKLKADNSKTTKK